jgi:polyketide synthase PksJ
MSINDGISRHYPLTKSQERLWVMWKLYPNTSANNIQSIFQLHGNLSINKFRDAINTLTKNNALFQTHFFIKNNTPYQMICEKYREPLEIIDFNNHEELNKESELFYINKNINQPIDLLKFPLYRIILYISKHSHQYYFAVVMPHILVDGVSVDIIFDAISNYYNVQDKNTSAIQALTFKEVNTKNFETFSNHDKLYWQAKLKNSFPTIEFAFRQTNKNSPKAFRIYRCFTEDKQKKIKSICKKLKTTPFILMKCIYAVLLYYFSNQSNITILYPVDIRDKDNRKAMGFYVNYVPVVFNFDSNSTIRSILKEITQQRKKDKIHQRFSFSQIVHQCLAKSEKNIFPFDAIFTQASFFPLTFSLDGIDIEFVPFHQSESFYPLSLMYDTYNHNLLLYFEYQTSMFERCYIETLATCYIDVLSNVDIHLDSPIHKINFISIEDQQKMLRLLKTDQQLHRHKGYIIDWVRTIADQYANRIAIFDESRILLYHQMLEKTHKTAVLLSDHYQLKDQARVAVLLNRGVDIIIVFLALLIINATYVPIDPTCPISRIQYIISDANCEVIISESSLDQVFQKLNHKIILVDEVKPLLNDICHKRIVSRRLMQDISYIIYTSGSTGKPKGTPISHQNMMALFSSALGLFQFSKTDIWSLTHSFAFDFSIWEIFGALLTGAQLVIFSDKVRKNPELLYHHVQRHKITVFSQTPSSFHQFSNIDLEKRASLSLKYVIFGGEKLHLQALQPWVSHHGVKTPYLVNMYGLTEGCVHATYYYIKLKDFNTNNTSIIGKMLPGIQCLILNEFEKPVPMGVIGELCIGGPTLTTGYLNNTSLNKEKFVQHPINKTEKVYKTGDQVFYDGEGLLHYIGRRDEQVKLYGYRIELNEINTAIRQINGIDNAKTLLISKHQRSQLISFYTSKLKFIGVQTVKTHLQQMLPFYMIPYSIIPIPEIPITLQGKIDKEKLLQFAENLKSISISKKHGGSLPKQKDNQFFSKVKAIWASTLGHERFSITDNFFDVGGNSILLIKLNTLLKETLDIDLPLTELFKYPSISSLINYLLGNTQNKTIQTKKRLIADVDTPKSTDEGNRIAVIGVACHFPHSKDAKEFWNNLSKGRECITFYKKNTLNQSISNDEMIMDKKNYVGAKGEIDGADFFDAEFFNYNTKEASSLDPQQRLFLEYAWHALEDAGYTEEKNNLKIGVFASQSSLASYKQWYISKDKALQTALGEYKILINNNADFLTSRLAYKFNLTGPNMTIQTGCSSSLVSICQAAQSLINGQCDIAIAGGVTITMPLKSGYLYQPGMILSPDGHCRPFDQKASGTVPGNGVGVVVLKKLSQAITDNDHIEAVIEGFAQNNDGAEKMGFTAPNQTGQEQVIKLALHNANLSPNDITYLEAHGTGTVQGDPIEANAIDQVFQPSNRKNTLAVGSVKSNIGHLDAAAGIAGFIKTVLCLKYKTLVPSLHFNTLNPAIHWEKSKISVSTIAKKWKINLGKKRIAGVSSFAIGGTNAHVIVSEAPRNTKRKIAETAAPQLILLSAKLENALMQQKVNLTNFLMGLDKSKIKLEDISYTLSLGRKAFPYRTYVISTSTQVLIEQLKITILVILKQHQSKTLCFYFQDKDQLDKTWGIIF